MCRFKVDDKVAKKIASIMSRSGYMPTVEARPSTKGLLEGLPDSPAYIDLAQTILANMMKGNLESSKRGGRRVKRVQRPDGLFHAGMILFGAILDSLKARNIVPASTDFGAIKDRMVRP
jgi:hypothetical protein